MQSLSNDPTKRIQQMREALEYQYSAFKFPNAVTYGEIADQLAQGLSAQLAITWLDPLDEADRRTLFKLAEQMDEENGGHCDDQN
jgi:hypothetical protein